MRLVPRLARKRVLRRAMREVLPDTLLDRPKSPLRGYVDGRVAAWRTLPPVELARPVERWVDVPRWRRVLATGDAESVHAAWRVFELSRWLAQPKGRPG